MAKKNFSVEGLLAHAKKQSQDNQESIKENIKIIEELKALIPALTGEEFSQLEENILSEGCREALILWKNNEDYVLIDGHNRYQICQKHKVDFKIVIKEFVGIEEVKGWMINNQLGRRNLTPSQQSYLRGKRYEHEKSTKGGTGANQYSKVAKVATLQKTHEKLAKELNVSARTIMNDAEYAKGLDKIGESNQTLKQAILSGKSNIDKGKIRSLGKISEKVVIDTEQDIDNIITTKQPRKQSSKPTIEQMREVLENAGSKVIIEIKGDFLIENNLAVYWQELRQLEKPITADFTDYITWGQAKTIGLVK
jgi:hypothetical protein